MTTMKRLNPVQKVRAEEPNRSFTMANIAVLIPFRKSGQKNSITLLEAFHMRS